MARPLYEQARGARVIDVSDGHRPETRDFLTKHGCPHVTTPSADLLALDVVDEWLIEVKGRGGWGNVTGLAERQLATHRAAGDLAWLYVVFNTHPAAPCGAVARAEPSAPVQPGDPSGRHAERRPA